MGFLQGVKDLLSLGQEGYGCRRDEARHSAEAPVIVSFKARGTGTREQHADTGAK